MWTSFSNQQLFLKPHQVHVWSLNKSEHKNKLAAYWNILSKEEKESASKYRFTRDRDCSIIARGALRTLLGNYLKQSPERIKFQFGTHGKPSLNELSDIEFNVSHSTNAIVLAFVQHNSIGIDVEYIKRNIEVKKIAKHFFSKEEIMSLFSMDESYYKQAFYNCWTRKEAFIKALGSGLSFPLDQFVVSLDSTKEAALLDTKWDEKEKDNWVLKSFEPAQDYIGAVTVKGKVSDIQFWKY